MSTTFFLAAQAAQQPSMMPTLIMIIALFVIMWLFMIRPQQQRQKKIREFQNSLAEGTKIITGGGVHGTVKRIDLAANVIEVEVAKGVVIRVDKNYVFADAADSAVANTQK
jgi:preprotein translocase subunit YajC